MTPSWWGILGLIGWAYLFSMILYRLSNNSLTIMISLFILLLLVLLGVRSESSSLPLSLDWLSSYRGHMSHTMIAVAGIICSLLLVRDNKAQTPTEKIRDIIIFGILLAIAGYFTQPFGGIAKIGATPAWSLYSAAICCFVFPLIFWLVDVKGIKQWSGFLKPAGENPLLTYILPYLIAAILGYSFWPEALSTGALGFIRAVVFTLLILALSGWLTKKGLRLHL
jgi:hypothetical protein